MVRQTLQDVGDVVGRAPGHPAGRTAPAPGRPRSPGDLRVTPRVARTFGRPLRGFHQRPAQVVASVVTASAAPRPSVDPPVAFGGVTQRRQLPVILHAVSPHRGRHPVVGVRHVAVGEPRPDPGVQPADRDRLIGGQVVEVRRHRTGCHADRSPRQATRPAQDPTGPLLDRVRVRHAGRLGQIDHQVDAAGLQSGRPQDPVCCRGSFGRVGRVHVRLHAQDRAAHASARPGRARPGVGGSRTASTGTSHTDDQRVVRRGPAPVTTADRTHPARCPDPRRSRPCPAGVS